MSKSNDLVELFSSRLHEAVNHNLKEKVKELLTQKDPTIDWSKVTIISDIKSGELRMESDDEAIEEQVRKAYELVRAEQNEETKPD